MKTFITVVEIHWCDYFGNAGGTFTEWIVGKPEEIQNWLDNYWNFPKEEKENCVDVIYDIVDSFETDDFHVGGWKKDEIL